MISTRSTRPRLHVSIVGAAAALVLSACGTTTPEERSATPTATSPAAEAASQSTESTPAPGEWTLDDLKVGAKVPKEDLERLFPKWDVPEPPATLTEFSEQGAKDAAIYYDRLTDIAFYFSSPEIIEQIDSEYCESCATLRDAVKDGAGKHSYLLEPSGTEAITKVDEVKETLYEVKISDVVPIAVEQSPSSQEITTALHDEARVSYTLVVFDGDRWVPVYTKLDQGDL